MGILSRLRNLVRREELDRSVDRELAFHLAERIDELVADGLTEREARYLANRQFGNYTLVTERTSDMDIAVALDRIWQDLRYGARQLLQNPSFTAVAVLSLGLGIGANTAMFQLIDAVRLRTLPVQSPEQLATIDMKSGGMRSGSFTSRTSRLTFAHYQAIRDRQKAFSDVLAWSAARFNLSEGGEARYVEGIYVNADFFRTLGVSPVLGRTFDQTSDAGVCSTPEAVVSYAFFQREFAGDAGALGKTVRLENRSFQIAAVLPASFFGVEVGRTFDVALPLCADALVAEDGIGRRPNKQDWWLSMIGRLKPGWTVDRAAQQLNSISPAVFEATLPPTYRAEAAKKYLKNVLEAKPGKTGVSGLRREYERPLWILLATTGLVLLIACANLANLLLARASVREREIAVRQAIGASRIRLVAQLMSESLLLASLGALGGMVLAQLVSRGLVAFLSTQDNPMFVDLGLDWRVLGFTVAAGCFTCLLFGLMPAIRATRIAPAAAMRGGGPGATSNRERFGMRRALVVAQVALSLVLLTGALLFTRSLQNLMAADIGFKPDGVLSVNVDLSLPKYAPERRSVLFRELLEKISSQPGVRSAAQVAITPISGSGWNNEVISQVPKGGEAKGESWFNRVGTGYFRTMATTVLAGREFDDRDTLQSPKLAVVNEVFSSKYYAGQNPVGRTFRVSGEAGKPDDVFQIVGLVRNTKYNDLREDLRAIAYLSAAQEDKPGSGVSFVVRTEAPLSDVIARIKGAVAEISPSIGLQFRVLDIMIQGSLTRERLMATLSGGFGLLAGLLATLGLYGVISYIVARRRNEIGIRMALGANRGRVIGIIMKEAALLVGAGLIAGVALALGVTRWAESLLYGLKANDPSTVALAVAVLAGVALAASFFPANRAGRLNPMTALRHD